MPPSPDGCLVVYRRSLNWIHKMAACTLWVGRRTWLRPYSPRARWTRRIKLDNKLAVGRTKELLTDLVCWTTQPHLGRIRKQWTRFSFELRFLLHCSEKKSMTWMCRTTNYSTTSALIFWKRHLALCAVVSSAKGTFLLLKRIWGNKRIVWSFGRHTTTYKQDSNASFCHNRYNHSKITSYAGLVSIY